MRAREHGLIDVAELATAAANCLAGIAASPLNAWPASRWTEQVVADIALCRTGAADEDQLLAARHRLERLARWARPTRAEQLSLPGFNDVDDASPHRRINPVAANDYAHLAREDASTTLARPNYSRVPREPDGI